MLRRMLAILCLTAGVLFLTAGGATGGWQRSQTISLPQLIVQLGITQAGMATPAWREAIHARHTEEALSKIMATPRRFSPEETLWADLIRQKAVNWPAHIDSLRIPFSNILPPDTLIILLGNQGGEDAFLSPALSICFDLNKLYRQYGPASDKVNHDRIDRFFAHEVTHVLHKIWRHERGLEFNSPFDYALWECLTEGLGNYRSLSGKWLRENGELSQHAQETLQRLQPVFVERISALRHARETEAAALLAGLSSGAFDQKWGALTVALWLAQEARGDDRNLRKWVEAGPNGVLTLARHYLPEELKIRLPKME